MFGTGTTPDETPYEIVAYRASGEALERQFEGSRGAPDLGRFPGAICPAIDFPSRRIRGDNFFVSFPPFPTGRSIEEVREEG